MKSPISYREAIPPLSNIEQFAFILVATILILTLCFFALAASGCGGGSASEAMKKHTPVVPSPPPPNPPIPVKLVAVKCASATVGSGATDQCTATVTPPTVAQTVTWSASAGTIDANGLLTAPKVTTATTLTVTAASTKDATKTGSFNITVNAPPSPPPPVASKLTDLGPGNSPIVAVDGNGNVDVAFFLTSSGIFFAQSIDGGQTFSQTVVQAGNGDTLQMELDSQGTINLLWLGGTDFNKVLYSRSTDGRTFSAPLQLAAKALNPRLAVSPDGRVTVMWPDTLTTNVFWRTSTDGVNFSTPKIFFNTPAGHDVVDVVLATGSANQVYAFFTDEGAGSCIVKFARSLDGAQTFSSAITLSSEGVCSVNPVAVIDSGDRVNVAWHDSNNSIVFARSTDQGQTFFQPVVVFTNQFNVAEQRFAFESSGAIDIVWTATQTDFAVQFARSTDGVSFSIPKTLSLPQQPQFTGAGGTTVAVLSCGQISVFFSDDSNGTFSGDFDIYEARTVDGVNFSAPSNLSNSPNQSDASLLVATDHNGVAFVAWSAQTAQTANVEAFVLRDVGCQ
jgi:hypothetical protein